MLEKLKTIKLIDDGVEKNFKIEAHSGLDSLNLALSFASLFSASKEKDIKKLILKYLYLDNDSENEHENIDIMELISSAIQDFLFSYNEESFNKVVIRFLEKVYFRPAGYDDNLQINKNINQFIASPITILELLKEVIKLNWDYAITSKKKISS